MLNGTERGTVHSLCDKITAQIIKNGLISEGSDKQTGKDTHRKHYDTAKAKQTHKHTDWHTNNWLEKDMRRPNPLLD